MNLEITEMGPNLPCSLEIFRINGIDADVDDFGERIRGGDCFENTCSQKFEHKLPTDEVLAKYGITLSEYSEVCEELSDKLRVIGCGMCS